MTKVRDYSQSREQKAILAWAKNSPPGLFLDIGAGDGEIYSNTRMLYLAGWTGVAVEAAPDRFDRLSILYYGTEIECVLAAVAADARGLATLLYARGDHLSSTEEGQKTKWIDVEFEPITVMTCHLWELLDYFGGDFQFVSIDTEGTTLDILRAYTHHPAWEDVRCLCVEIEDASESSELEALCPGWTRLAVTPNNVILARPT